MRWFTSDTHFGHKNIIKYCDRPFADVEEMDRVMTLKWNAIVAPDDVVFHLGDVALGTIAESLPKVAKLNGFKYLIPGNHDRVFSLEKGLQKARWFPKYNEVFTSILPEQIHLRLANEMEVVLSHFPYVGDSHDEDRFEQVRPQDMGLPIVHGHVHEKWKLRGNMLNVGVDVWNFYPVSEDDVIDTLIGAA